MEKRLLERNIRLYQIFQAFCEPIFWGPILILFLNKAAKMSLPQIFFMEGVVVAAQIFLQLPTGALADLIGRKKTMLIGSVLFVADNLFFAAATCPWMAWTGNILWVIGFSLVSGADSALLFDSLRALGREKEYKKIQGKALYYRYALMACSCLCSGYLAEVNLRLPAYLSVLTLIANCFVAAKFIEPLPRQRIKQCFLAMLKHSLRELMLISQVSLVIVWKSPRIKWLIAFSSILAVVSKIWMFTYNPYFELVKLPLPAFGMIFCALNIIAAISSRYADQIYKKIGDNWSINWMILLVGVPMIIMGIWPAMLCAFLILFQNFTRGYMRPFIEHLLHDCLDSKNRATILSIQSAVASLGQSAGLFLTGLYLAKFSFLSFLIYLGALTLISGLVLASRFRRTFS